MEGDRRATSAQIGAVGLKGREGIKRRTETVREV